jgi:nicotinamide-nucleotide amidase
MRKDAAAQEVHRLLGIRDERVVFAESCTAGACSATMGAIPGASKHLCGSAVTYMPKVKRHWVGVKKNTIKKHTTESQNVANEMALGVLDRTPCANWSVAVVGHLGPDSPEEKDGQIFVAIARRTHKGRLKVKDTQEYICKSAEGIGDAGGDDGKRLRVMRQDEAVEVALTCLARLLNKKTENDGKGRGKRDDGIVKTKPGKSHKKHKDRKGTDEKKRA